MYTIIEINIRRVRMCGLKLTHCVLLLFIPVYGYLCTLSWRYSPCMWNRVLWNIPTRNFIALFLCSSLFRFVVRFARVVILNSRLDGSRKVLVSVSESDFPFHFFVGNFHVDIFLWGNFWSPWNRCKCGELSHTSRDCAEWNIPARIFLALFWCSYVVSV